MRFTSIATVLAIAAGVIANTSDYDYVPASSSAGYAGEETTTVHSTTTTYVTVTTCHPTVTNCPYHIPTPSSSTTTVIITPSSVHHNTTIYTTPAYNATTPGPRPTKHNPTTLLNPVPSNPAPAPAGPTVPAALPPHSSGAGALLANTGVFAGALAMVAVMLA